MTMRSLLVVTQLTLHEAARRRVLTASLLGGVAFLVLYAIGLHFIVREATRHGQSILERQHVLTFLTLAGLYVVHFLSLMSAVLLPVDTLSGEIASGVIQTVASKPVHRSTIVLGKWLAYALVTAGYLIVLMLGVVLISRWIGHHSGRGVAVGLPLMMLSALVMTTLSIAGGTRFSTVTNGILAFALFGLAFIGGWVDQIGTMVNNDAARYVGTIAGLILPSETLWQLAAWHMQPPILRELQLTPFSPASVPSLAVVWWSVGYIVVALLIGVRQFSKRPL